MGVHVSIFTKLLNSIDHLISSPDSLRREAYVAQGQNVQEIESRMRELESDGWYRVF